MEKTENSGLLGKAIQEVANERGCTGVESALSLLDENQGRLRIISFNQSEENLRKVLTRPLTVIITDGLWTEGKPHPRTSHTTLASSEALQAHPQHCG